MTHSSTSTSGAVDMHAHLLPADLLEDLASGRVRFPNVKAVPHGSTYVISFCGAAPTRPVSPGLTDPARRGEWLSDNAISRQVVGGWLDVLGYDLPPDEGADWADLMTARVVRAVSADERLIALGTVPLQDPVRAADALRKHRSAGLPGVMIATRVGERELDDAELTPFWEAADDTEAIVFIHPGYGGAGSRYHDFGLVNGLGRLEDSTVTLARLLYSGIPAQRPAAQIIAAHGGASLPFVLGRLVQNHLINSGTTADPLESFTSLYFDSVVFDPKALAYLVSQAGADHVLLGSDYPFPIGDLNPRAVIEKAGLPEAAKAAVLRGTAGKLLGVATS